MRERIRETTKGFGGRERWGAKDGREKESTTDRQTDRQTVRQTERERARERARTIKSDAYLRERERARERESERERESARARAREHILYVPVPR